jgi:hypothetical protein
VTKSDERKSEDHTTGKEQAEENKAVDPPA